MPEIYDFPTPEPITDSFEDHDIRRFMINGDPWWVARDVCQILGYSNNRDAIRNHCLKKGVDKRDTPTRGGVQSLLIVNESNLYRLISHSKKPESEKFEEWIHETVMPSIRKGESGTICRELPDRAKNSPTTDLITDSFEGQKVRRIMLDGEPWWVAADVCKVIGLEQTKRAMDRLDSDEKGLLKVTPSRGLNKTIDVNGVNEPGLYQLIIASNKPAAKKFKRWITHEILPAIRKTGAYQIENPFLDHENTLVFALEQVRENKRLEAENTELRPKGDFYDTVVESRDVAEMATVAKTLNFEGVGRNRLFEILREEKVLTEKNEPQQDFVGRGYFRKVPEPYKKANGEPGVYFKTVVFPKGMDFIRKILKKRGYHSQGQLFNQMLKHK